MKPLTEREVIVLARKCGMRVCSTEEHHGCPYGDESMVDCVERLEADYEAAVQRMLAFYEEARDNKLEGSYSKTIRERITLWQTGQAGDWDGLPQGVRVFLLEAANYMDGLEYMARLGAGTDGYHSFDELYRHRTELFAALCNLFPGRAWKSTKHFDGTMEKGWFIAGIDTPEGQATYHCRGDFWNLFRVRELETAPKWDGHTPEDVLLRIREFVHTEAAYVEKLERRWETIEGYVPHCCANCGHKKSDGSCELLPDGDQVSIDYTEGFDRDDCEHWDMFIQKR